MGYVKSTAEKTRGEVDRGQGPVADKPGKYRSKVVTVKDHTDDESPSVMLVMQVTGTESGQSPLGSTLFHRVYFTDKTENLTMKFYLRCGLLREDAEGRLVDSNGLQQIDSDELAELEGTELCADWGIDSYTKDNGSVVENLKIPYNEVWLASDPMVRDWECNRNRGTNGHASEDAEDADDDFGDI